MLKDIRVSDDKAQQGGGILGGLVQAFLSAFDGILALLVTNSIKLFVYSLKLIFKAREDGIPELTQLAAAVLSEYLGVEISAEHTNLGQGVSGPQDVPRKVGDLFIERLKQDVQVQPGTDLGWAETNAKTFAGIGINFGIQNALIAQLAEALSVDHLHQIRELGNEVAHNSGLSRLQRLALQPLIQNAISKPYDKLLRAQYRQDNINEAQLVHALSRGSLDSDTVRSALAQKGYPDNEIEILIEQLTPRLSEQELFTLMRHNVITQDRALEELMKAGIPQDTAQLRLQAIDLQKADTLEDAYISELASPVKDGFIDTDTGAEPLQQTHLTEKEQHQVAKRWGPWNEYPHKRLTLAEVQTGNEDNLLTLDNLQQWASDEGYSELDELMLEYLTLKKADATAAKAAAAAKKA